MNLQTMISKGLRWITDPKTANMSVSEESLGNVTAKANTTTEASRLRQAAMDTIPFHAESVLRGHGYEPLSAKLDVRPDGALQSLVVAARRTVGGRHGSLSTDVTWDGAVARAFCHQGFHPRGGGRLAAKERSTGDIPQEALEALREWRGAIERRLAQTPLISGLTETHR
jgi:hypothetical protein